MYTGDDTINFKMSGEALLAFRYPPPLGVAPQSFVHT